MSEFNWWLLIVGLVVGAGLVWLILADSQRRESAAADEDLATESDWIAETLAQAGQPTDSASVEQVLRLHRTWLASLPPEDADGWSEDAATESSVELSRTDANAHGDAPVIDADAVDEPQARGDAVAGTTPTWSATEPSPRRR